MSYSGIRDMKPFFEIMPKNSNLYEFGVCTGNSIRQFLEDSAGINTFNKVYGFDSFEGLPKEADGIWCSPDWKPGVFNVVKEFGLHSKEEAVLKLLDKFSPFGVPVEFVDGWYNVTLTDELAARLINDKIGFLHIDTDLYISALEAMDWVFKHDLLLIDAIVRFDDWNSTPEWTAGESLAMKEVSTKYSLQWVRFTQNVFQYKGR